MNAKHEYPSSTAAASLLTSHVWQMRAGDVLNHIPEPRAPWSIPSDSSTVATTPSVMAAVRESLLMEHLPSVRYIARKIHERLPQHVELEDLISAGTVGLIDALNKFDCTKKVQFRSYAQFRIRGAILDSLRVLDWGPRELRRKGRAVQDATLALTRMLHRNPSEQEIADEMHLGLKELQTLMGDLKGLEVGSLNLDRSDDSDEEELAYVAGSPDESPLHLCLVGETRQRLIDAIEELPEKERMVLTLYYYEELTMREIGLTLGVVESRVSQIHSSALRLLRSALRGPGAQETKPHPRRGLRDIRGTKSDSSLGIQC